MIIRERLAESVERALAEVLGDAERPAEVRLDVPPSTDLGDFSTDGVLEAARARRLSPAEVAAAVAARITLPPGLMERVESTPTGILNFHLRAGWVDEAVDAALEQRERFGAEADLGAGQTALLEYVSAQPTAPLTVTHARGASVGDAVANMLSAGGYQVTRENYINDAGIHADRFSRTVTAMRSGDRLPLDGFPGAYAARIAADASSSTHEPVAAVLEAVRREHAATLERMGVHFDHWRSEAEVLQASLPTLLAALEQAGASYVHEGALWLRSTGWGDLRDRVLRRSSGSPTYLAGDLAYHQEKYRRGYALILDFWAADHQDYILRTRAGLDALGCDPARLEFHILGPVSLTVDGTLVEGPSPAGNTHLLDEVMARVGADVMRLLLLLRPTATPVNLNLDQAGCPGPRHPLHRLLLHRTPVAAGEGDLARKIAEFPDEVRAATRARDPHRLLRGALELCDLMAGEPHPRGDRQMEAGEIVLRNALRLLGVDLDRALAAIPR